jgi:Dna[CI] antecedent DciA-like protein
MIYAAMPIRAPRHRRLKISNAKMNFQSESRMEPARAGLRQIMSDLLRRQPPEEAVPLAWPLVCGKEVAARSQAVVFTEGKLTVEVPDATWRSQLQAFAARYLREFEALLGPVVRSVEFKLKQSAVGNQASSPKRPTGTMSTAETQSKSKGASRGTAKRNKG